MTGSRVRRVLAVALPALSVIAVLVAEAVQLQALHMQEVLHRPTPRIGWYDYISVGNMVSLALSSFVTDSCLAIPAVLVLWRLGRRASVSGRSILASAWLSVMVMGIFGGRIQPALLGLVGASDQVGSASPIDYLLVTPATEELLMLAAVALVLVLAARNGGVRAGMVLGAAVGLGMTVLETGLYIQIAATGGLGDFHPFDTVAMRFALLGLNLHAVTAALSGGALAAWIAGGLRPRGAWLPLAGLAGAMATHAVWNGLATDALNHLLRLVSPEQLPVIPVVFAIASAIAALFLAIPFLVLALVWRRARPANAGEAPLIPEEVQGGPDAVAADVGLESASP